MFDFQPNCAYCRGPALSLFHKVECGSKWCRNYSPTFEGEHRGQKEVIQEIRGNTLTRREKALMKTHGMVWIPQELSRAPIKSIIVCPAVHVTCLS